MLCTFCGTENHPENKFCGMCGVRLERRKEQRRVRQASAVKCASCGHLNDFGTKFCGMCGTRVDRRATERRTDGPRAAAIANAQLPTPEIPGWPSSVATQVDPLAPPADDEIEARNAAAAIFRSQPSSQNSHKTISGPSFLGLGNDPANGNSDYLLDDEPASGGIGKIVFLVILILIGGLGYMGWRSGFFTNIHAAAPVKHPSVPAPTASPSAAIPDQGGAKAVPDLAPPAKEKSTLAPLPGDSSDPQKTATSSGADDPSSDPAVSAPDNSQGDNRADKNADKNKAPKEMPTPARRKPSTALIQAQNYLQGRGGVHQDCEQGLIYLKAATEKNDPAAAVQMGALYASGHCVQQDRVMAYRWFNSAHELDPANPWIQTNLDQLWAQMTSAERKQVGR